MSEFIQYLKELFNLFGDVHARRMFGGYGLYHDDLMFGLVVDDVLYLKADEISAEVFEGLGRSRFEYEKSGKNIKMSYYLAPETIYDDPECAKAWAILAYEAALRAKNKR